VLGSVDGREEILGIAETLGRDEIEGDSEGNAETLG